MCIFVANEMDLGFSTTTTKPVTFFARPKIAIYWHIPCENPIAVHPVQDNWPNDNSPVGELAINVVGNFDLCQLPVCDYSSVVWVATSGEKGRIRCERTTD